MRGSLGVIAKRFMISFTDFDRKLKYLKKKSTPSDATSVSTSQSFSSGPLGLSGCFPCPRSMSSELTQETTVVKTIRKMRLAFQER